MRGLILAGLLTFPSWGAAHAQTAAVTATCKDGTAYAGAQRAGACRGHGGVQAFGAAAPAAAPAPVSDTAPLATSQPSTASAAVIAVCKDGTDYSGAKRAGACRGHGGVQAFGASSSASPAPSDTTVARAPVTPGLSTAPVRAAPSATAALPPAQQPVATVPQNSPVRGAAAAAPPAQNTSGGGQVWVNLKTKVYHCPGDRNYGTTVSGSYMTEASAKAEGDRPSRGKVCS